MYRDRLLVIGAVVGFAATPLDSVNSHALMAFASTARSRPDRRVDTWGAGAGRWTIDHHGCGGGDPATDRIGRTDDLQEGCESPNRELKKHALRVPKWVPIRRKTMEIRPIRILHSTELAGIFKGLAEGWKTAKPLCVGSIPTRASNISQQLILKRFSAWLPFGCQ
jgi:hypothetical protein